ncbi:TatD family hydrolase [Spiroplasma endosymbiont of Labia minor]|uniref:TatD family hydrolase n=1 Tax=Spiroplasma endosymbiont of Labia minor TaxID=3066305 RepID=UPI0030D506E1
MKYLDSHTHLNEQKYKEEKMSIEKIIKEAHENDVVAMIDVGYDIISSQQAVDNAINHPTVFAAIGIHPNEVSNATEKDYEFLEKLIANSKVIAIGEIGLDYYYSKEDINLQRKWFIRQIRLAIKFNKTIMLHIRDEKDKFDAYYDALEILKLEKAKNVMLHCFTANIEIAKIYQENGFYISIGGISTFKNAIDIQEAIKIIDLDKMLIETDAPYLAPDPFRGKTNYPKYIKYTVEAIARLKNIPSSEVAINTYKNALEIFKI